MKAYAVTRLVELDGEMPETFIMGVYRDAEEAKKRMAEWITDSAQLDVDFMDALCADENHEDFPRGEFDEKAVQKFITEEYGDAYYVYSCGNCYNYEVLPVELFD